MVLYNDLIMRACPVAADLHRTPEELEQRFVRVPTAVKVARLLTILQHNRTRKDAHVMVFVNSVDTARLRSQAASSTSCTSCTSSCSTSHSPP